MEFADGTVIPHYLSTEDVGQQSAEAHGYFDNIALMVGEVQAIVYPNDEQSESKEQVEYVVQVWQRTNFGATVRVPYRCRQADLFGGLADHFRFSHRPASKQEKDKPLSNGATVLLMCLNGDQAQGIIVGAVPHPDRTKPDPSRKEPQKPQSFLDFEFNGVKVAVDDDGALTIVTEGQTDVDGKPGQRESTQKGSTVVFAKDGSILVSDKQGQSLRIDPKSKTIEVLADKCQTEAKTSWKLKAPKVVVVSPDVDLGDEGLQPPENGVVFGSGIDTFTGAPYFALGNASKTVKVKK